MDRALFRGSVAVLDDTHDRALCVTHHAAVPRRVVEASGQQGYGGLGSVVMLDQTPIGDFLELEGAPRWIDRTARTLGFSSADYITASYGRLYLDYCVENGVEPGNMVFTKRRT